MRTAYSLKGTLDVIRPSQGIADFSKAGLQNVMLDMACYHSSWELETVGKKREPERKPVLDVNKALDAVRMNGMDVTVVKAPQLKADSKRSIRDIAEGCEAEGNAKTIRDLLLEYAKESIRIAEELGTKYVIIAPVAAGIEQEQQWEVNKEFYLELASFCRKEETCILLTNQCRNQNGHLIRGICSDPQETVAWIEELNREYNKKCCDRNGISRDLLNDRFAFCLDTAIATICGQDMQSMIHRLDSQLKAVILRDCDGCHESSLLPFTGVNAGAQVTDWLSLIRGLRDIHFDGELVLDMSDTAASFSPLLRHGILSLAGSVGDFMEWQITIEKTLQKYSSIVLFGAGNMCRNYMKCYGEKYPPLFTCDNNPKLWDTEFCGLTVRSPENLRDIPADCGVIICNVYYREIEQQLRDMGIKNIGYFNDEYMPSYYTDRIVRED